MANEKVFKGLVLTTTITNTGASGYDKDTLYLVRTSGTKTNGTDGYFLFNGKKYGTAYDVKTALISGETTYTNLKKVGDAIRAIQTGISAMEYVSSITADQVVTVGIGQKDGKITGHSVSVTTKAIDNGSGKGFITYDNNTTKWSVGTGVTGVGLAKSEDVASRLVKDEKVIASGLNKLHADITAETEARKAAITALTTSYTKTDDYVTVEVDQTNGKISKVNLNVDTNTIDTTGNGIFRNTSTGWTARVYDANKTGLTKLENIAEAVTNDEKVIAAALNLLSGQIKTNEVHIVQITPTGTSSTGINKSYALRKVGSDVNLGAVIDVYKDSFLKDVSLIYKKDAQSEPTGSTYPIGHSYLKFIFITADGSEKKVYIDVHDLQDEIQAVTSTTTIEMGYVAHTTGTTGLTIYAKVKDGSIKDVHIANDAAIVRTKLSTGVTVSLNRADTALQKVNSKGGTAATTAITLYSTDITLSGASITGITEVDSGQTIHKALQTLSTDLFNVKNNSVTSITSTGNTIMVSGSGNKWNVEVRREATGSTTVAAGHIEIAKNDSGALYGLMYFSGDDVD